MKIGYDGLQKSFSNGGVPGIHGEPDVYVDVVERLDVFVCSGAKIVQYLKIAVLRARSRGRANDHTMRFREMVRNAERHHLHPSHLRREFGSDDSYA